MQQTARSPGRPRPADVIARDDTIYALIADGHATRAELAAQTGLDRAIVQLSCKRLHKAGRIRQCLVNGSVSWSVADGTPCP